MADRGDTHYRVSTLNRWFAFSSLVLLVSAVWMMWDDFDAEWKPYQQEFREIDARLTREQLESMTEQRAEEERLAQELERVRADFEGRQDEIAAAEAELFQLRGELVEKDRQLKVVKALNNWDRYVENEVNVHAWGKGEDRDRVPKALANLTPGFQKQFDLEKAKELAQAKVDAKQAELEAMTAELTAAETAVKNAGKQLDLLRNKLEKLEPTSLDEKIANQIRDFPGLDFVDPRNRVRKVVLPEIKLDLNFTKKPRIDMCMTCHMGIDREGFEDEEQPYTSHPRLDLFLSATSPHPLNQVGCTACHGGSGEALSFQHADHRPSDDAEREEWREEYHWHKQHHWDYPMLATEYTEAGCVQCHKTSMDLIADEAPTVSEGYRLFEESGCYSCHKVEWFPTTRKRGPSLKNVAAKLDPDFTASWIARPKDFRPTTRMPQVFHLENYEPEDVVVKSNYGQDREMYGQEWNDASVAAVTAFLYDRAPQRPFPDPPVEGDAERGRETFRLAGCLACHNVAPHDIDERLAAGDRPVDPALVPRDENEMGPNLRGVATKLNQNWLFAWLKDPKSYWPGTRMPDLRLSDQEAADITAYMLEDPEGWFSDVPDTWESAPSPYDREVLVELARWYFNRIGRVELQRRLDEEWSDDEALLSAVGEKLVMNQGCFSCHEIGGMELAMPIGTELTAWGSKTVDKLDFGFMHEILAEEKGWSYEGKIEFKKYREGWLENKLHQPRSYDRLQVKNPLEKLKMPYFGFTDEQVQAVATFVVGLVNDDVHGAKMTPDADQRQMEAGLRGIRQKNCAACHVLAPGQVAFTDEDGERHLVHGELLALDEDVLPPPMDRLDAYVADYEEYWETDVEELIVRLLETAPGLGEVGDTVIVPREGLESVTPPHGGTLVPLVARYYLQGVWNFDYDPDVPEGDEVALMPDPDGEGAVEDVDGEFRYYGEEPYDKVRWTFAPPVLLGEGDKVQNGWFYAFLNDPVPLREQMRVRMPSFTYEPGEAGAIADYFALRAEKQWTERYARRLRHTLGLTVHEMAEAMGVKPEIVRGLEAGERHHLLANRGPLLAFGAEQGFAPSPSIRPAWPHPDTADEVAWSPAPPVEPGHERLLRRDPSYRNARLARHPDLFATAEELAAQGPNCFQCHFYQGVAPLDGEAQPIAWAPDLFRVQERIREDWAHQWLKDPGRIYPGTAMPANFSSVPPVYQELLPDSTNEDQIQIVLDWMFNMDRKGFRN